MSPLAHVGHWLVDLIYLAPLVLLGALVLAGKVRTWRKERQGGNRLAP